MKDEETDKILQETWSQHLGKYIYLSKKVGTDSRGDIIFRYEGKLVGVHETGIILLDKKIGRTPISFDGLTLTGVRENV